MKAIATAAVHRWIELDRAHLWHPFTPMAEWCGSTPLVIERAEGNYLIAGDGSRYLDGVSSLWVNVHGHRRDEIDRAVIAQLGRVAHTTLLGLASPPSIELAHQLVNLAPPGLTRVFYSDSGSTAVEIALKQAFQFWQNQGRTQKRRFVHLEEAYHGDTLGAVAVGGIGLFHRVFAPLLPHGEGASFSIPTPHPRPGEPPEKARARSLDALGSLLRARGAEIAALIVEPLVQAAAGMLIHPPGYLAEVAALCRQHEVLLVADEVATGFGRTGTMFACQQEDVRPDFLCLAKGLTGGYLPLAATLSTEEVYRAFLGRRSETKTFYHGHTYTGNPLACAAALASLDLFASEHVLEQLPAKITALQVLVAQHLAAHPRVGAIRQKGLMAGIELVAQRQPWTPFAAERALGAEVCAAVRRHGVILRPLGDVVVVLPPLSIQRSELETIVAAIACALDEVCP